MVVMVATRSLMLCVLSIFIIIQAAFSEQTPCDAKTPCAIAGECCVEDVPGSGRGFCTKKLQRGATCSMTGGYDAAKDLYIATTSAPATCGCDDSKNLACFPNVGGKLHPKLPANAHHSGTSPLGPTLPPGALPPNVHLHGRRKRSARMIIENLAEDRKKRDIGLAIENLESRKKRSNRLNIENLTYRKKRDSGLFIENLANRKKRDIGLAIENLEARKKRGAGLSIENLQDRKKRDIGLLIESLADRKRRDIGLTIESLADRKKRSPSLSIDNLESRKKRFANLLIDNISEQDRRKRFAGLSIEDLSEIGKRKKRENDPLQVPNLAADDKESHTNGAEAPATTGVCY